MKKKYMITTVFITIVILLVVIGILLMGLFGFKQYIRAIELEDAPDNYINISETDALLDLFNGESTNIKYLDNFYQIQWST